MSILDNVKETVTEAVKENVGNVGAHAEFLKDLALKHADDLKKLGMPQAAIDNIVNNITNFDFSSIDSIPGDDAHAKFKNAVAQALQALESGKTTDEAHSIFSKLMSGKDE